MLSCFLVHLELKWQIRLYTPVVPLKTIPGSRPKCAKSIPFFRLKRPNNPTLWGSTYLYGFYKGVPSQGFLPLEFFQLQNITCKLWLPVLLELPPPISILQSILLGSLPPPPHSHPSCCLSFWVPYPPLPTHIPPAAYPSGLPKPHPLPPMNALEESITEILQCP